MHVFHDVVVRFDDDEVVAVISHKEGTKEQTNHMYNIDELEHFLRTEESEESEDLLRVASEGKNAIENVLKNEAIDELAVVTDVDIFVYGKCAEIEPYKPAPV